MLCPICKHETVYAGNPFRPFCSERCRLIDLDNWLEGRYRIPVAGAEKQDDYSERGEEALDEGETD